MHRPDAQLVLIDTPGLASISEDVSRRTERFLASDAFKTVYDDAYRHLYHKIYAGADALNVLDGITKVLASTTHGLIRRDRHRGFAVATTRRR